MNEEQNISCRLLRVAKWDICTCVRTNMSLYVCTYFPFLVRVHVFSPPCTCARITTIPYFVLDAMVSYFEKGNTTVVWIQFGSVVVKFENQCQSAALHTSRNTYLIKGDPRSAREQISGHFSAWTLRFTVNNRGSIQFIRSLNCHLAAYCGSRWTKHSNCLTAKHNPHLSSAFHAESATGNKHAVFHICYGDCPQPCLWEQFDHTVKWT